MIRPTQWKWLVVCGTVAAAAHADPSTSGAAQASMQSSPERQCDTSAESSALARFDTGTTFMLTDKGLIVLKRAAKKTWYAPLKSDEPEFPNTGN
jgi:hypothetical protein